MQNTFRSIRSWTDRHNHLTAFIFFFLLIGVIYFPVLIGHASLKTYGNWPPGPLFVGDPLAGGPLTYPMEQLVARAWASFQLPLWNPYQAYGLTLGGNQGVAWFLPEIVTHLLFPHNFSIWNVLRLVLMAQGAYLLARELDRSFTAAILAGLFYGLAGPALPNVNLGMDNTLLVFPYLLIALRRMVLAERTADTILWVVLAALAVDFSFLAGFAEVLPLQFLFALFFTLSFVPFSTGGLRRVISVIIRGSTSLILGILGSLISIYTLLLPLRSYFTYQSPASYTTHAPLSWLGTLIDPTLFGQSLAGGRFTEGQTVWILGNPVWAFLLIASMLIIIRRALYKERQPAWLFVSLLAVVVGVLGYADVLGILKIFSAPPFNLIIMVRFLEFFWWLPSCLVLGWGYDQIGDIGGAVRVGIMILSGSFLLIVLIRFGLVTAAQATTPLEVLMAENITFSLVFIGLLFVNLIERKHLLKTGLLILSLLSLILFVPKNYFPRGTPFQGIQSGQSSIARKSDVLFFRGINVSPVLFSGMGVHTISAFGPFYPSGYANLIAGLFSSPDPTSPNGALFFAAETLSSISLTGEDLARLSVLGVTKVANMGPLQFGLAENPMFLKAIRGSYHGAGGSSLAKAVNALAGVYLIRPDLQNAFPYTSATLNQQLLNWALTYGTTTDSAHTELAPFRKQYKVLSAIANRDAHLPPIVSPAESPLLGVPSVIPFANGGQLYVYPMKNPQGFAFAPRKVLTAVSQSTFDSLLQRDPTQLLNTAFILRQGASAGSSTVRRPVQNLRVSPLSYSPGFDHQTMKVRAHGQGLLVLRVQYTKHVVVTVNGVTVHPVPVDGVYTGLYVKKGGLTIRFNYVTPAIFWSTVISALVTFSLVAVAAVCQWSRRNYRKKMKTL